MKLGAYDYITKPFDLDEVLFTVRRALTQKALIAQVQALAADRPGEAEETADEELVGRTPAMLQVFKTIGLVAATGETVLIAGESGTGKELVAGAIHRNSNRAGQPFIKVNCAALTHVVGKRNVRSRTGSLYWGRRPARRPVRAGERGHALPGRGGDLDIDLQAKLLRVLQTGEFERVGGNENAERGCAGHCGDQPKSVRPDRGAAFP